MGDETTTLHAISIEGQILQTRGLRFDAPEICRRTDPKGCRYWWGLLEFAFDMEDPTAFPPLKVQPAKADAVLLRRYCETAEVLAQSKQLVAANHISIRATRDPETGTFSEEVEVKFAPPDLTAGFGAYFRQLYGDGEPQSFLKASGVLFQAVKRSPSPAQDAELRVWRTMERELRAKPLQQRLLEKLHEAGEWPPLDADDHERFSRVAPDRLISEYLYGDHIHRDRHADLLEERKRSQVIDATLRMNFMEAMFVLAHVYMGFAQLIRAGLSQP